MSVYIITLFAVIYSQSNVDDSINYYNNKRVNS